MKKQKNNSKQKPYKNPLAYIMLAAVIFIYVLAFSYGINFGGDIMK